SPANNVQTTPMAKKIVENKIKLVFIDSSVNEEVEDLIVSTDNFKAGQKMGDFMMEYIKEGTKIGIVSSVETTSTAIERQEGLRFALGDEEEKIVDVV